jgi:hypothetical protein
MFEAFLNKSGIKRERILSSEDVAELFEKYGTKK